MIRIAIQRNADGRITSYRVEGHAFYDDPGKDIVCAGVSAVTVGTVNAVEALTGLELEAVMEHGLLHVKVPSLEPADRDEKVQLLLEGMAVMLESIQQSYGAYIAITTSDK
ncbi:MULTISPECIES: ribosomal-processing cysteine protease Prp [Paenibacillus]|uniref:ribosomal-processing cysteine protease Prp n=1 Tax=Paenibacillus TaxID=44249 RepID=UPI0022B85EAA|nr:ribosomal-processing cysteine protease Prp [Paenibacillus caseinilyticus]MCZ8519080.1 ribosomal-processing cysteine protease Prp [Paenibacillus caseinilyticus]